MITLSIAINAVIIRGYGSFVSANTYNPGLTITHHNPTLTGILLICWRKGSKKKLTELLWGSRLSSYKIDLQHICINLYRFAT